MFLDNDAGGTGLTAFYNGDQSNASIRGAAGQFTASFSLSSRIDIIVDPALRQVRYTYDASNNLTTVID